MTDPIAEIFAAALGMNERNAAWAWTRGDCANCDGYGYVRGYDAPRERCPHCKKGRVTEFTATSPLAAEPHPAWLYALTTHPRFFDLTKYKNHFEAAAFTDASDVNTDSFVERCRPNQIHAVAHALLAADPELKAAVDAVKGEE